MMKYELIEYPNPILETVCEEVKLPLSKEDENLLNQMYEYIKTHPTAVGLAAPQFGVAKRMIVIRHKDYMGNVFNCKMVNPKIVVKGNKNYFVPEGEKCLSEPDFQIEVKRHKDILLIGYDTIKKANVTYPLSNFRAAIAQHEVDHLNGILLHTYKENIQ